VALDSLFTHLTWIAVGIGAELIILGALFRPKPEEPGTVLEKNFRFLIALLCVFAGSTLVYKFTQFVEGYYPSPLLDGVAAVFFWAAVGALVGGLILTQAAREESEKLQIQELFRPLHIVKNQIDKLNKREFDTTLDCYRRQKKLLVWAGRCR
jgi:hypothetical protein